MKDTRERILDAATRVFSRQGVSGATTRGIASVARVNEVTLFRYFKNKNELLRQMVLKNCQRFDTVFADAACQDRKDLRRTVEAYSRAYHDKISENVELVRTFYGEMNRNLPLCRRLFVEAGKPVRQQFISYLKKAQKSRLVRANLDPVTAADALTGMISSGVIRGPLTETEYQADAYFKTCVETFLRGIES